jgi:pyruvate,water dikinase
VPAVGEELVSGERAAEEWIVKGELATRIRAPREALSPSQALEVAALARRIAEHFGEPQDVEWAYEDGVLQVLQARPITALPDAVEWTPPMADVMWMRNFRIGEWLPEPATPLFSTMILPTIESVTAMEMDRRWAWRVKPVHALVNGWVFCPAGSSSTGMLRMEVRGLILHPKTTVGLLSMFGSFDRAIRLLIDPEERRWREDRRPRYLARVERGSSELDTLDPGRLVALAAELAGLAGEMLWSIQTVAASRGRPRAAWPGSTWSTCARRSADRTSRSCAAFARPRLPPRTRSCRSIRRPHAGRAVAGVGPPPPSDSRRWSVSAPTWRLVAARPCRGHA